VNVGFMWGSLRYGEKTGFGEDKAQPSAVPDHPPARARGSVE